MEIGKVIRKYRKENNMTQEEMARYLGVTAPAVNKWENGSCCPDIMLLAPIARLLGITLEELLSFREDLTEEEIGRIVRETDARLKDGSYQETFEWAKGILEQYPNCHRLRWQLALIFDAQRMAKKIPDTERYDEDIRGWYERALDSGDEDLRFHAADSLFGFYFRKEQYEKAQSCLEHLSPQNPERKRKQADIYSRTGRTEEAYKAYEELLFFGYQRISMYMQCISQLALQEKDMGKLRLMAQKQEELARLFEMGEYQEDFTRLQLAVTEQNVDATIENAGKLLSHVESIGDFAGSALYGHLKFSAPREEFLAELKENLRKEFRDRETYGYLAEDERWQSLVGG